MFAVQIKTILVNNETFLHVPITDTWHYRSISYTTNCSLVVHHATELSMELSTEIAHDNVVLVGFSLYICVVDKCQVAAGVCFSTHANQLQSGECLYSFTFALRLISDKGRISFMDFK